MKRIAARSLNVASRGECALHLNRGRGAYRRLGIGGADELEPGFVDGFCVHDLGVADLQRVFGIDRIET